MPRRLRDLVLAAREGEELKKAATLLYLAGADLARDLAGELREERFTVVTQTTYRMIPVPNLPREVCDAFAAQRIEAVLHYSRRSARAFLDAARAAGIEISALAIPQCCLSDAVAAVVREAGATQVMVAATPDENALFEALGRILGRSARKLDRALIFKSEHELAGKPVPTFADPCSKTERKYARLRQMNVQGNRSNGR